MKKKMLRKLRQVTEEVLVQEKKEELESIEEAKPKFKLKKKKSEK